MKSKEKGRMKKENRVADGLNMKENGNRKKEEGKISGWRIEVLCACPALTSSFYILLFSVSLLDFFTF